MILSKNGVPSSPSASRLALMQVFLFLTYFPSSNMNSSIIKLCLWSIKWKLYDKNAKFSNLASLVALRVCFDATQMQHLHIYFNLFCIMSNLMSDQNLNENKKIVNTISLTCSLLCCFDTPL